MLIIEKQQKADLLKNIRIRLGDIMNLKLVSISDEYKDLLFDMMDEWLSIEKDFSPYAIRKVDYHDFENYKKVLNCKTASNGYAPSTTLFALDLDRNIFVGGIDIRHYINRKLYPGGGHIGDGIRPSERRKGYASEMIRLGLLEAKKLGIKKCMMTCNKTNIGSAKSIINNNGILDREFINEDGEIEQIYWIDL